MLEKIFDIVRSRLHVGAASVKTKRMLVVWNSLASLAVYSIDSIS